MHSILYTFDDAETRDKFASYIGTFVNFTMAESQDWSDRTCSAGLPSDQLIEKMIKSVANATKDPEIKGANETTSRVFVGNKLVYEGMHKEASARWESEVVSHSAKVELKSYKAGAWKTIRIRK
jgi:hypothetical protein